LLLKASAIVEGCLPEELELLFVVGALTTLPASAADSIRCASATSADFDAIASPLGALGDSPGVGDDVAPVGELVAEPPPPEETVPPPDEPPPPDGVEDTVGIGDAGAALGAFSASFIDLNNSLALSGEISGRGCLPSATYSKYSRLNKLFVSLDGEPGSFGLPVSLLTPSGVEPTSTPPAVAPFGAALLLVVAETEPTDTGLDTSGLELVGSFLNG
jgi:hypothetical protein